MRSLHLVNNFDNQLCFAINLALLLYLIINLNEASLRGRELQYQIGLSLHFLVSFSDTTKLEQALDCKMVIFFQADGEQVISTFQTFQGIHSKTGFLFLFRNHYYGIANLKTFLGTSRTRGIFVINIMQVIICI